MTGAPRVDVQATSPCVACIDAQFKRFAARPNVHEDALYTLLMEFIVISKAHNVLQQPSLINLRA
jgi:hypothetical protein